MANPINRFYKGCIFDLDGTLVNTLPEIACSVNTVLERHKKTPYQEHEYKNFIGYGVEHLIKESFQIPFSHELFPTIYEEVLTEYRKNSGVLSEPFPYIHEILQDLSTKNIPLAILTNKPQAMAEKSIDHFFSSIPFDPIIGAQDSVPKKPHPYGLHAVLKQWDVPASQVIFFGDSTVDIQTAKAANITVGAVGWGFSSQQELQTSNPDQLYSHPKELHNNISTLFGK